MTVLYFADLSSKISLSWSAQLYSFTHAGWKRKVLVRVGLNGLFCQDGGWCQVQCGKQEWEKPSYGLCLWEAISRQVLCSLSI